MHVVHGPVRIHHEGARCVPVDFPDLPGTLPDPLRRILRAALEGQLRPDIQDQQQVR